MLDVSSDSARSGPRTAAGASGRVAAAADGVEIHGAVGALDGEAPPRERHVFGGRLEEPRGDLSAALDDAVGGPGQHHAAEAHRAPGVRAAPDGHEVGVAGDEPHLLGGHAEPLGHELGEARLVALARRQRADDDLDAALGAHRDLRSLARRAGRDLDVVGDADAAVAAALARLARAAPGNPAQSRELGGARLRRAIVAAVVDDAERIRVGHGGGGHEVSPPELERGRSRGGARPGRSAAP